MNEGMSEDIEMRSVDDVRRLVERIITDGVSSGKILPGEYMVVDNDGVMIGDESDFDSDVLLYAIKIDDVVDFDNGTVDMSSISNNELFHDIF